MQRVKALARAGKCWSQSLTSLSRGFSAQPNYAQNYDLQNLAFSHPEAQMGFHPDAGASFYLSRLPGYLGEYLALTGDKLDGVEMIACRLATHYTLSEKLSWIEERLSNLHTDDPSLIESSLAQYGDIVYPEKTSVLSRIDTIDRCFSHDTVEEIFDALIREGRFESLDQCLVREYRVSLTAISKDVSNDFCEGVRARFVDKDFAPKWDPPSLGDVSEDMVNCYFSPRPEVESELELPTASREPY
ncbi:hypothetical protein L484_013207 [Morus notabilis]|uniref:3-hydroxyisobutyryl-CoA hydrolase n=1 Tax=Morus notabilis TaxID=981085 RepID=W9S3C9_9ROSA|nr:hypothetical protein L484_013207 [Morus notabilis]